MDKLIKSNPEEILQSAKSILLVDWPNAGVPRALINAGFVVYSYSPDKYSEALLVEEKPTDQDGIAPGENEHGYLIFRKLKERLETVDVVNIYRPENELAGIVEKHILPLSAKTLWLHPPWTSELARGLAAQHCLEFVQGVNIAEVANEIKSKNPKS
ncbi:MAG TPA: CoA-binding protein [Mucilaginibacter sp.]|jgi:predicted CoA-binding protein|nr:CoA-binding protein [Mucilaginibacter sp.]